MTVVANLEDELVLHRDFERVDASKPPRTKREARLEEARELDRKLRALVADLAGGGGRRVPADEAEADLVHRFYRRAGPLARAPLEAELARAAERLGVGRPLATILAALERRIVRQQPKEDPS